MLKEGWVIFPIISRNFGSEKPLERLTEKAPQAKVFEWTFKNSMEMLAAENNVKKPSEIAPQENIFWKDDRKERLSRNLEVPQK